MKIEAGKYYRTRDGRKVGPMKKVTIGSAFTANNMGWNECGVFFGDVHGGICYQMTSNPDHDLIAEWQDETTGTLAELGVKAGDVVECIEAGNDMFCYPKLPCIHTMRHDNRWLGMSVKSCKGIFRIISRANQAQPTPTPTLWRDMTPEEKGALLLANHEGQVIETWNGTKWIGNCNVGLYHCNAYRIAPPKPVVETVEMYASKKMKGFGLTRGPNSTHRITFDTVDGVPDCGSVKMEEV